MNVSNFEKLHLTKQFYPAEFYFTHEINDTLETHTLEAKPIENSSCLCIRIDQFLIREMHQYWVYHAVSRKCRELEQKMGRVWMTQEMGPFVSAEDMVDPVNYPEFRDAAQIDRYRQNIVNLQKVYGKMTRLFRNVDELKEVYYLQFPKKYQALTSHLREIAIKIREYLDDNPIAHWDAAALLVQTHDLLKQSVLSGLKLNQEQMEKLKISNTQLHVGIIHFQSLLLDVKDPETKDNHYRLLGLLHNRQISVSNHLQSNIKGANKSPAQPVTVRFAHGQKLVVDHQCLYSLSKCYRKANQITGEIIEFDLGQFSKMSFDNLISFQATGTYANHNHTAAEDFEFATFIDNDAYLKVVLRYMVGNVNSFFMLAHNSPTLYETAVNSLSGEQLHKLLDNCLQTLAETGHIGLFFYVDQILKMFKPLINRLFIVDQAAFFPKIFEKLQSNVPGTREILKSVLILGINRMRLKFHQFDSEGKNAIWEILRNAAEETRGLLEYLAPFSLYLDEDQIAEVIRAFPNVKHFEHAATVSSGVETFDYSLREKHLQELKKLEHLETVTLSGREPISRAQLGDLQASAAPWPKIDPSLDFYSVT